MQEYNNTMTQYTGENEPDHLECKSCGQFKHEDDFCDHDWQTQHQWCRGCCIDNGYEDDPDNRRMMWEDLD